MEAAMSMHRKVSITQDAGGRCAWLRLVLALSAVFAAGVAAAEQRDCHVIDSLPATIAGGVYCLAQNLSTSQLSGPAIRIGSSADPGSNTVLDCNGHSIIGPRDRTVQTTTGVLAREPGASNIIVRNCVVTGFINGIIVDVPQAYVANNRLHDNFSAGIMVRNEATVVDNHVMRTGAATSSQFMESVGILAGAGSTIRGNTIHWVYPSDQRPAYGIRLVYGDHSLVEGNHVANVTGVYGTPSGVGIQSLAAYEVSGGTVYRDNTVVNSFNLPQVGIACSAGDIAVKNIIVGFPTGVVGCAATSGNVVSP
jgi:hypothetical protein